MSLYPWTQGPFDLILHGEQHLRDGDDFGRRIALISFDQSIEASVSRYLSLHPIHRQNRTYKREDVPGWLRDFHTKVDFFVWECQERGIALRVSKEMFIWYHNLRSPQYHEGGEAVPQKTSVEGARDCALFVFETLFDVPNVEQLLNERLTASIVPLDVPSSDPDLDAALDAVHGDVLIAGIAYSTSELLFRLDHIAYQELGLAALDATTGPGSQAIAS